MANPFNSRAAEREESHWLSVSDLMAGLMIVFLFVAIALMRHAIHERDRIKAVAVAYKQTQVAIYDALMKEFKTDLPKWNAEIDKNTLTVTFNSPDVLFQRGDNALSDKYRNLLADFFPRYMKVLKTYQNSITEVRIEGYTSSIWNKSTSPSQAYFLNMRLSQGRTRSVLKYVYGLDAVKPYRDWIKSHMAAIGFSSAKPILGKGGQEDYKKSRRVTFRVLTNSEVRIKQILEMDNQ